MTADLAIRFTDEQIIAALARVRLECRFIALADIVERIQGTGKDDGRPGPEEAWAMCPKTEEQSVVWTAEMAEAFGDGARQLLRDGDAVAARMAFRESYQRRVETARREQNPMRWTVSFGWDQSDRVRALIDAVEKKRLSQNHAMAILGPEQQDELRLSLTGDTLKGLLPGEITRTLPGFAGLLQRMQMDGVLPAGCDPPPIKPDTQPMSPEELKTRRALLLSQATELMQEKPVQGLHRAKTSRRT